jgi:hypothetical protein
MNIKKHFSVFCLLTEGEVATLAKRFTQEQLQSWLGSKLDAIVAKECEQIEIDESYEEVSKPEKL